MCQLVVGEFLLWKFGTPGGHSIVIKLLCIIIIYFNLFPEEHPQELFVFIWNFSANHVNVSYDKFLITRMSVRVVGSDCFHILMGNCIQRLWKEMTLSFGDQTGIR